MTKKYTTLHSIQQLIQMEITLSVPFALHATKHLFNKLVSIISAR